MHFQKIAEFFLRKKQVILRYPCGFSLRKKRHGVDFRLLPRHENHAEIRQLQMNHALGECEDVFVLRKVEVVKDKKNFLRAVFAGPQDFGKLFETCKGFRESVFREFFGKEPVVRVYAN